MDIIYIHMYMYIYIFNIHVIQYLWDEDIQMWKCWLIISRHTDCFFFLGECELTQNSWPRVDNLWQFAGSMMKQVKITSSIHRRAIHELTKTSSSLSNKIRRRCFINLNQPSFFVHSLPTCHSPPRTPPEVYNLWRFIPCPPMAHRIALDRSHLSDISWSFLWGF